MTISVFLNKFNFYILNPIIVLFFALAFVYFIYGIIKFLRSDAGDKGTERIEARNSILWGIIGMFIMFSVYALIKFVLLTFGITPTTEVIPYIKYR